MADPPGAVRSRQVGATLEVVDHDYRLVPASQLDLDGSEPLLRQVEEHGGLSCEVLDAFEEWVPLVLFQVDVAWSVLEQGDARAGVATRTCGNGTMALLDQQMCSDPEVWNRAPALGRPGRMRMTLDAQQRRLWQGQDFRLVPHAILDRTVNRDWAHAWPLGWDGALRVELSRSRKELDQALRQWEPLPYARIGPFELQEPSGFSRAPKLVLEEGRLCFHRSYHEPSDAVVAFDKALLARLCAGELGPLRWCVSDDDYGQRLANGDDCASLAEYLR